MLYILYTRIEINLSGKIYYYTEKSAQKYVIHDVYSSTHQKEPTTKLII